MAKHAYTMPAARVAGALDMRLVSEMVFGLGISLMLALVFFGMMKPDPVMAHHAALQVETVR